VGVPGGVPGAGGEHRVPASRTMESLRAQWNWAQDWGGSGSGSALGSGLRERCGVCFRNREWYWERCGVCFGNREWYWERHRECVREWKWLRQWSRQCYQQQHQGAVKGAASGSGSVSLQFPVGSIGAGGGAAVTETEYPEAANKGASCGQIPTQGRPHHSLMALNVA